MSNSRIISGTKKSNTRFNPTVNGSLHLGHLYIILVNECEAHRSGGEFSLRFDDDQFLWKVMNQLPAEQYRKGMIQDLTDIGVKVDYHSSQEEMSEKTHKLLDELGYKKSGVLHHALTHSYLPETKDGRFYPFVADYTAEKVVQDFIEGIDLLIRGEDLLTEFSLYNYFCSIWDLPTPRQVFLPKLKCDTGELSAVSKTIGNFKIRDWLNSGKSSNELIELLRKSCLVDPVGEWTIANIKKVPFLQNNK